MERINYRITLDTHKTGIQRTLQGFETADNMSRRISINLKAGSDTVEIPFDHVVAMMYVTSPDSEEPSINECTIEDNTIIYDVLPIMAEGITEMQLKVIETRINGAKRVLVSPRFAVEVTESGVLDDGAEQSTTFTALETAVAQAKAVYDSRLVRIEIDDECMFRAYYADGTVYESDVFYEMVYKANYLMAQSYAVGGTGIRDGEDTDNAKYYSNITKAASIDSLKAGETVKELLDEARRLVIQAVFKVNFKSGELEYESDRYSFNINEYTGQLEFVAV